MKIAILSPLATEKAETFIQNHITELSFEKVVIYGGNFPYKTENYAPGSWQKRAFWLRQNLRKVIGKKAIRFEAYQLGKILRKEQVEVVFSEYLITGAETFEVCKALNIPLISIALGYDISMKDVLSYYKEKYSAMMQYATKILIVSNHMKKNLLELGCDPNKILYTPAGPAMDFFDINPTFSKKQVLAIGRFVDKKAPYLTILAFLKVLQVHPEANLVMAGDGILLNMCMDLVKIHEIQNSVKFVGLISTEQHMDYLAESFMFVQHSKLAENGDSEGTPVAILEASAASLPIVSTLHAGIPDIVKDGETGFLVPEYNIELMAQRMIDLLNDKRLAQKLGMNGKKLVKINFTLEQHINKISNCINNA